MIHLQSSSFMLHVSVTRMAEDWNLATFHCYFGNREGLCIKVHSLGFYLLTYSMVQSSSWEANWFAASQEIPRISRNPNVHYRTHKRPQAPRMWVFLNISVLQGEVVSTSSNPQAGGPPLVGCPRLLIQFIRSYPSSIRNLTTRDTLVTGTR